MSTKDSDGSKSDVQCPWEGCDYTSASERGIKIHHKATHGESIAGVVVDCHHCGDTLTKKRSKVERSERNFCNIDCRAAWQSELEGSETNNWKGGRPTVSCDQCGTTKQTSRYAFANNSHHFCGQKCEAEWRSENLSGPNSPSWEGGEVTVACSNCSDTKQVTPAFLTYNDRFFCNDACKGEWYSANLTESNNPNWNPDYTREYGYCWDAQREKALDRDGRECVICGRGKAELGQEPDVHHIVPKAKFDSFEAAHQLDNLVSLCRTHHQKWEGIPLRPQ